MQITKDFLQAEIRGLELEIGKAQTFLTQAQAVLNAYNMLLAKLDEPEPESDEATNGGDLPQAS
jgi:hypothetical protein